MLVAHNGPYILRPLLKLYALRNLGHDVIVFSISDYMKGFSGKLYTSLPFPGTTLFRINQDLLHTIKEHKADLFLSWRPTYLFPSTIQAINSLGVLTVSYNNDDPFKRKVFFNARWHQYFEWFWYLRTLRFYQRNFFFRKINLSEAKEYGAAHADVLMPYFIPEKDRPVTLTEAEKKRYSCDVVFVGHHEFDGREKHLQALVQSGLSVKLFGSKRQWTPQVLKDMYSYFSPIEFAEGDEYPKALSGAKVCLAFLSKRNRDPYTTRCFEIPACGRVMLAERTDDLLELFEEDKEACFFSDTNELVTKAKWLVENPDIADSIAQAGLRRVWADGHDVDSRVAYFIKRCQVGME